MTFFFKCKSRLWNTPDKEKHFKSMIENLQTTVNELQTRSDALAIELKQVLLDLTKSMKEQDEQLKEIKEEIKRIANIHAATIQVNHRHHLKNKRTITQDDHSGGRKRPKTAKKRRFTVVIFTLFHRISIHFWSDGLRRRINAVFCRFVAVSGRLRAVLFDLARLTSEIEEASKLFKENRLNDEGVKKLINDVANRHLSSLHLENLREG